MREAEVPVTFHPSGKTVYVLTGTRLIEAAAGAGLVLDLPCGGEGVCGKCRVKVQSGACEPTAAEENAYTADELEQGFRLACQSSVCGPMSVEIPHTSLPTLRHKILVRSETDTQPMGQPAVRKQYVELSLPGRGDDEPDLIRLQQTIGPFEIELGPLRDLSRQLREAKFRGTAVFADGHLIGFESGNTEAETYAVAVDLGTTTLAAVLLDLSQDDPDTDELAVTARVNPQTRFGDDVLSRILHASENSDNLRQLQETIVQSIDEMIGELVQQAGIRREQIYEVTFSGNTTMQQLFCGIDPHSLGEVPFVPATGPGLTIPTAQLGLHIHPHGSAYVLPVIGGFVGGDTVSGILATGLAEADGPTLLVDIGTNGEIVLCVDGKLTSASTAAGPAFEGARILHGMRAADGAIEKVVVDEKLRINVIGDVAPVGLCGSALIDLAAELLRHQIITERGRLQTPDQLPDDVLPDLAQRLIVHEGQVAFLLVSESDSGTSRPIVLTQRDIRELQLATGAIRAGIGMLLARAGIEATDLDEVLIAGGFGNFIRRNNAQRIGLMPARVPHRRIRYRGNTSLAGARLMALSKDARDLAEDLARRTEHVDLSCDMDFQTAFAEAMIFPEDESSKQ